MHPYSRAAAAAAGVMLLLIVLITDLHGVRDLLIIPCCNIPDDVVVEIVE